MTRLTMAFVVVLGVLAFVPTKADAGVYVRAPYFSLNINRPWGTAIIDPTIVDTGVAPITDAIGVVGKDCTL